jgi:parallel beta-helix repeat protein
MMTRVRIAALLAVGLGALPLPAQASVGGSSTPRRARVVVVDDDRAQCPRADVTTIAAALALVRPGGTIAVCPGTYAAGLVVDKPGVTVEARGAAGTVRVLDTGSAASGFGFAVVAGRVTISGFEIAGYGDAPAAGEGIAIGGIPQPDGTVVTRAADRAVVRGNKIHGALVPALDPDGNLPSGANGIDVGVFGSANATITGNELDFSSFGIEAEGSRGLRISGNTIHDHGNWGVIAQASTGAVIEGNRISRSQEEGVYLNEHSDGARIRHNRLLGNFQGIVVEDGQRIAIADNTAQANDGVGIGLLRVSRASVTGNTASGNSRDGISVDSSQAVTLAGNVASGNGTDACTDDSEATPCPSGIDVVSSSGVVVRSNRSDGNSGRGIRVRQAAASRFSHDSAHGNGLLDLDWDGLGSNLFADNACGTALPSTAAWGCR